MKPERIEELMRQATPGDSTGDLYLRVPLVEGLHLLRCARAWADIEDAGANVSAVVAEKLVGGAWEVQITTGCTPGDVVERFDLLTATEAALAKAKEQQ